MHIHNWGQWKVTRRGTLGDNNIAGSGFDKAENAGEIGATGDFLVQERQCSVCGFVKIDRQEVY
jgi:hypothetical protein